MEPSYLCSLRMKAASEPTGRGGSVVFPSSVPPGLPFLGAPACQAGVTSLPVEREGFPMVWQAHQGRVQQKGQWCQMNRHRRSSTGVRGFRLASENICELMVDEGLWTEVLASFSFKDPLGKPAVEYLFQLCLRRARHIHIAQMGEIRGAAAHRWLAAPGPGDVKSGS